MSEPGKLSDLRKSYELGTLDDQDAASEPLQQFRAWLDDAFAHHVPEPNAMTLATADPNGRPSCRPVLVKECDERGFVWYCNYESRKGRELAANPFAARPLTHRIGAWASPQSAVIPGRTFIVARAAEYGLRFGLRPPRPPHWGGYRLRPDYWEFWQGRASRLHDRIAYRPRGDEGWIRERLAP